MNDDELLVLDVFDAQRDGSPSPSASVRAAQIQSGSPLGQRRNFMYLFNYFDQEDVTQFKKQLFQRHEEELREQRNQSIYTEMQGAQFKRYVPVGEADKKGKAIKT